MGGLCLRFLETKVLAGHFQKQPVSGLRPKNMAFESSSAVGWEKVRLLSSGVWGGEHQRKVPGGRQMRGLRGQ